jgi:hypothetical protein
MQIFIKFLALVALVSASLQSWQDRLTADSGDATKFSSDGIIIKSSNETVTSHGWTEYKQCDSAWANNQLGTCSETICSAGCAMSSVAMILTTKVIFHLSSVPFPSLFHCLLRTVLLDLHQGVNKNPGNLNSWLKSNGGYASGCNIVWNSVDKLGVTKFQGIETASESAICSGLSAGHGIVANVHNGGHYVLLTACAGNGVFYVNDPGYSTTTYKMSDILKEAVYH